MFSYFFDRHDYFDNYDGEIFNNEPLEPFYSEFRIESPFISYIRERNEREAISLKEIKSNNKNFMKEKNIKYNLYPLYINWKKIETKESNNNYFNIYKLYGYFGSAIYSILEEVNKDCEDKFNYKNFIFELSNTYLKEYDELEIDKFYDKLIK